MNKLPITAIVLTFNEEKNIENCLKSIHDFVHEIFIVDSYSTDSTVEIVKRYTNKIIQHPFENYSKQRNWALENLPINYEWILNLDADHRVTKELKVELQSIFSNKISDELKGFMASRRTIFLGKWIKNGGHYPAYHSVLFRKGYGMCEDRLYDQHFVVNGKTVVLKGDIEDIVTDSLTKFVERHNHWATLEAEEIIKEDQKQQDTIKPSLLGNPIQRRRFYRKVFNLSPLFLRSFLYFIYRYFLRFGFLDGKEGLIFHFLQGFWFRFLIDAKIYELKATYKSKN